MKDDEMMMTDKEYKEYLREAIMRNLKYMVAEGFVKIQICPDTGETLYCRLSDEEINLEISNV